MRPNGSWPIRFLCLALLLLAVAPAEARLLRRSHRRGASLSLRRRLFTSPLITDPGNLDLEYSGAFDTNSSYTLPMTLKYTPDHWQTELSVGVDTIASVVDDSGNQPVHFSDHLNLAATTAFHASDHFDWGFAPTLAFLSRGSNGERIGGLLLGRYDRAGNTLSGAVSWSGATQGTVNNPAGTWDVNLGYGRQLSARWSLYGNTQWERSTGVARQYAFFEGVEFQMTPRLAFDLQGQHYGVNSDQPDHQIVAGITFTLYKRR